MSLETSTDKKELITARTPELADLFEVASLAREEDDTEE